MMWLYPGDDQKQEYRKLRLYAPKNEKIYWNFQPLRICEKPGWNPVWDDWYCYAKPLRIYQQDYALLLDYFNQIYPVKDIFHGKNQYHFDVCSDNWIGKDDWNKIIAEIERDLENNISDDQKSFFVEFVKWLREALDNTTVIVVEGNL